MRPDDRDARHQSFLHNLETGAATGFVGSSGAFFNMVRTHTLQCTFGDPYYGGNANFIGWDLLGYPGLRLNVSTEDQRLGAKSAPTHTSAYDNAMFTKAVASSGNPREGVAFTVDDAGASKANHGGHNHGH